jgi:DNA-binding FadR family transcriptional regulator
VTGGSTAGRAIVDAPLEGRVSRAEVVARALEARILEGKMAPGTHLGTKEALRRSFGVAVATVNEAVRLLEVRGLVEARPGPGGGVFVAPRSARTHSSRQLLGFRWGSTEARDCARVRLALDAVVVQDAAAFQTPADIAGLRRQLDRMAAAIEDPVEYLAADWALHRVLADITPNEPLRAIYQTLLDFQELTLATSPPPEFNRKGSHRLHVALVDAIEAGDQSAAAKAEARHRAAAVIDD